LAFVLWITGLPGSGKSTVADGLKQEYPDAVVLRMDDMRRMVTPSPTYSEEERDLLYRALVYFAKVLFEQGHNTIIDATGNRKRWRELARESIKSYVEVYLRCPIEICQKREKERKHTHRAPRDIYEKALEGWPVPGVNVPYEEPEKPEIIFDVDKQSIQEIVQGIRNILEKKIL